MARGRRWKLTTLAPEWVEAGQDWGAGVSFDCPTHKSHRLTLHFHHGLGGWDGNPSFTLYQRYGDCWGSLTVRQFLRFNGCFRGTLALGELEEVGG